MPRKPYIGAYWSARNETLDRCMTRLRHFILQLAELGEDFGSWYEQTDVAPVDRTPLQPTDDVLRNLLASTRNRDDVVGEPLEQFGYYADLWNGSTTRPISLTVNCGSTALRSPNHVVMKFPSDPSLCSWMSIDTAVGLVVNTARAWAPDWCTLTSHEWRRAQKRELDVAGWVTYGSSLKRGPNDSRVVTIDGLPGVVVVASEECNDETTKRIVQLADFLNH